MLSIGSKTPSLSPYNTLYINNASQVLQSMIKLSFCNNLMTNIELLGFQVKFCAQVLQAQWAEP
jgi:hypothetical protein